MFLQFSSSSIRSLKRSNSILYNKVHWKSFSTTAPSSKILKLRNDAKGTDVIIFGTSKFEQESISTEVKNMIRSANPKTVLLSMDRLEGSALTEDIKNNLKLKDRFAYASAIEEAEKVGAKIVFGDVRRSALMVQFWDWVSWKELFNMIPFLFSSKKNEPNEISKEYNENLKKEYPTFHEIFVNRRVPNLISRIKQCEGTTVGIVGLGLVDEIEKNWKTVEQKEGQILDYKEFA
jgi:pheromone shutdown protein TraB